MKRTILGAAVAFAIFAFQGGIASAQDTQPATFGLPYGAPPQYAVAPLPEGVQPIYQAPIPPAPPCGPAGICPPLIPGQAVEPPIDAGPGRAPMPAVYATAYQPAPVMVPVQQPYYAQMPVLPLQPVQPIQPVVVQPTGYYYNQLGNAIPLPPLFPGQVVEPFEDRGQTRAPIGIIPGQVPPAQPTSFAPAPTFAPVTPPAGAAAPAPVPVRVITTITPSQVKQALAERIPLAIVDVRTDLVRDIDGHVPGDLHVPLGPEATFITRLAQAVPNRAVPVVFYCRDGSLGARAAALSLGIGYKPYLMGAYQGW